jgi:O-antigen/teichoic acid export membrane protein
MRDDDPHGARQFFTRVTRMTLVGGLCVSIAGTALAYPVVRLLYRPEFAASACLLCLAVWQMALAPARVMAFQALMACHAYTPAIALSWLAVACTTGAVLLGIYVYGTAGAVVGTVIGEMIVAWLMLKRADAAIAARAHFGRSSLTGLPTVE